MESNKIFGRLAMLLICSLFLAGGCANITQKAVKPEVSLEKQMPKTVTGEAVPLILKFIPADSTTYKVVMDAQRSVKWEGAAPDTTTFEGGQTGSRNEMIFTQQIQSVNSKGNAIAKITIEGLKYSTNVKDRTVIDFDSSRQQDANDPMAKLIGQNYTIEITPTGQVSEIIDVNQAQGAVKGGLPSHRAALKLLSADAIRERHGVLTLPAADKKLQPGDNWSSIKTFSFGMMGAKSCEKTYTLKEIKDADNRQTAVIEMNTVPTSETAEQLHKEQGTSELSKMFDNVQKYTGQTELDLSSGKIKKCLEKMEATWTIVKPPSKKESEQELSVLIMSETRLYSLEKIK